MKFLSTILVLISACGLIKAAKILDRVDELNSALLLPSRTGGTPLDLTPTRNQNSECVCLPKAACTRDNIAEDGKSCTGDCGYINARINDGSCPSHLVLCCKDSIHLPTATNTALNTTPGTTSMTSRQNTPNLNPTKPLTMQNCPCVRYYQCVNGTLCTDGCNLITEKTSNDACKAPDFIRCCPEGSKNISVATPNVPNPGGLAVIPGARSPTCSCLPMNQCYDGIPCTDGCGAITIRINGDTCQSPNVLCCKGANSTTPTPRPPTTNSNGVLNLDPIRSMPTCPCVPFYQCYNGTPCTDGCNTVDIRINGDTCRSPNVLCCKGANITTLTARPPSKNSNEVLNLDPTRQMPTCPCVPFYQCYNGTACTDGCDVINIRINDDTCRSPNVLCCNNTTPPPVIVPTTTKAPNFDPVTTTSCPCVPHYICYNGTPCTDGCNVIDMRINHDTCSSPNVLCCGMNVTSRGDYPNTNGSKICGVRNPAGVGYRIMGPNNVAKFGEFPWMVAILSEEEDDAPPPPGFSPQKLLRYKCGGSIIHPQVVMTTTHCVIAKEKKFQIRAGEWDILSTDEIFPHQDRSVVTVITHPEYYSGALFNDIALLILDAPLNITEAVNTVCLPSPNEILGNIRCITSGWGKNFFKMEGEFQTVMKKVELPIIPKDTCEKQLKIARSRDDFMVHESFVCAGGEEGRDACDGDGGSPLVCPYQENPKRYYQAGIVSWGVGCGQKNVPGLYANVALFRNWVDQHMTTLGYDKSYYTF